MSNVPLVKKFNVATLAILLITAVSCFGGGGGTPPDDGANEPLIVSTHFLPAASQLESGEGVIDWKEIAKEIPRPYRPKASVEKFEVLKEGLPECPQTTVYQAHYNFNRGRNATERIAECLDRNRSYLMLDITAVIEIVAYLIKHVALPFKSFMEWWEGDTA